jgi:hypothetical protein
MARIQTYNNDVDIDDADKLVGTDGTVGVNLNKTKNFTLGDIRTFVNLGNTLNSVLTNGNTSLLDVKMGELYLYDITESNYAKIKIFDSEYNLYNTAGAVISTLASSGVAFYPNAYNGFLYVPNTITTNRQYEFPNKSGVVALISDVPSSPYQSYVALFTQSGTNEPVVTVVSNTLDLTITWVRNNIGQYYAGDITSKCPDAKTVYIVSDASNGINLYGVPLKQVHLWTYGNDVPQTGRSLNLSVTTVNNSGDITFADWNSPKVILIEIRVYN